MSKVISVMMQKGGVAKTTTTFNVAAILAERGYRVLMIDNDEQASLTYSAGFSPAAVEKDVTDLHKGSCRTVAQVRDTIYKTDIDNLFLIPANYRLAELGYQYSGREGRKLRNFDKAIDKIRGDFDYILIDNPPSLGFVSVNSLWCADYVLVPVSPAYLSEVALEALMDIVREMQEEKKGEKKKLDVLGVIVTMMRKRVKAHEEEYKILSEKYDVIGVVTQAAAVQEAPAEGKPVVLFKSKTNAAKQYEEITDRILEKMEGADD